MKCECLERDLHEKDSSVVSMKSQLSSMKAEFSGSSTTIANLEATIREKDRRIEILQSQRQRSGAENEEEVNRVKRSQEKLEARVASLREQLTEKDVSVEGTFLPYCSNKFVSFLLVKVYYNRHYFISSFACTCATYKLRTTHART